MPRAYALKRARSSASGVAAGSAPACARPQQAAYGRPLPQGHLEGAAASPPAGAAFLGAPKPLPAGAAAATMVVLLLPLGVCRCGSGCSSVGAAAGAQNALPLLPATARRQWAITDGWDSTLVPFATLAW